jgi:hypothetical protein
MLPLFYKSCDVSANVNKQDTKNEQEKITKLYVLKIVENKLVCL